MLNAIQTLIDEGCLDTEEVTELIDKCIEKVDLDDNRALVLLSYLRHDGNEVSPEDLEDTGTNCWEFGRAEYRVLDESEADEACGEYIEQSLWAFNSDFLANMTNLPEEVFTALSDKCEDGNDAVYRIVKSTCGIDKFVNAAVSADGRGHFLSQYDGNEYEVNAGWRYFYIYRTN